MDQVVPSPLVHYRLSNISQNFMMEISELKMKVFSETNSDTFWEFFLTNFKGTTKCDFGIKENKNVLKAKLLIILITGQNSFRTFRNIFHIFEKEAITQRK